MIDRLLSGKSDRRLIILVALILLDALTFIVFDVYAGIRGSTSARPFNTLAGAGWILNIGNILDLLSGRYSLDNIWAATGAFYGANGFILNKVAIILVSGAIVVAIYRYAPDLLPICYGYLLGIAGVGVYDGLQNIGVIDPGDLQMLPVDFKAIPQAIMTICVVAGGIFSFSKMAAFIFSQIVALQLFERDRPGLRIPLVDRMLKKTVMPGTSDDHRHRIPKELLPDYEKNIRELADLDTQNSIEAIQRSYDLVNQMAGRYGIDQYHVLYDVYREKKSREVAMSFSAVRESALDKDPR